MAKVKQSFISNLLGRNTYKEIKYYVKKVLVVGTSILCLLFALSLICHYRFISALLSLVTGTSIFFIIYIAALIITLVHEVDFNELALKDMVNDDFKTCHIKETTIIKTKEYKLTIVRGLLLLLLGIAAVYFSNKYRKYYAFECETFLVDNHACIYHLDCNNECEEAAKSNNLLKMQGFQLDKTYTFCEWCREWSEDAEYDATHDYSNY